MKMKSFRYGHEQNCKGGLENKPVKKHTNPRPKQQPKPKPVKPAPEVYYSDDEEEEVPTQLFNKKKQPTQPYQPSKCFGTALSITSTTIHKTKARKIQQFMYEYVLN